MLVKGSILTKGKDWIGPWQDGSGNGPLMISVPTPEDDGVVTRSITPTMIGASPAPAQVPPAPTAPVLTPPPATSGPASPGGPPPARSVRGADAMSRLRASGWDVTGTETGKRPPNGSARGAAKAVDREAARGADPAAASGETIWETPGTL